MKVTEVTLPVRVPKKLADDLKRLAEDESCSVAATARRLLARGISQEMRLRQFISGPVMTDGDCIAPFKVT